ncbi:MAG: threonine-phosphate decarboxylase [Rhodocyclaceae bacterium]|nr:MAG: threonine-phosphate decarboxylase [Rhodocyclaceae bacterium]
MLEHGGQLRQAALAYGIPLSDWLDLSTGINPHAWPVPGLPPEAWHRLPEDDDGLERAAAAYYGNASLLPVAGSQAAIQLLPTLLTQGKLAYVAPLYAEHPHAWIRAGHVLEALPGTLQGLGGASHALLCNPNNPTAQLHRPAALLKAAEALRDRGGWLVLDEAFIDATPEHSLTPLAGSAVAPNLIVLRSLGKFFGLAGTRVGFVFADRALLKRMAECLGPWTVAGPSRAAARLALEDGAWQDTMRPRLLAEGRRLHEMLLSLGEVSSTPLFATVRTPDSAAIHDWLARRGILTRNFTDCGLLRFGLPGTEPEWQRLADALFHCPPTV